MHTKTHIHAYIHTYIPTYLPTYIHTYIHTYVNRRGEVGPGFVPRLRLKSWSLKLRRLNSVGAGWSRNSADAQIRRRYSIQQTCEAENRPDAYVRLTRAWCLKCSWRLNSARKLVVIGPLSECARSSQLGAWRRKCAWRRNSALEFAEAYIRSAPSLKPKMCLKPKFGSNSLKLTFGPPPAWSRKCAWRRNSELEFVEAYIRSAPTLKPKMCLASKWLIQHSNSLKLKFGRPPAWRRNSVYIRSEYSKDATWN